MKKRLTTREKVLMCILVVLMVVCAYNLLFYNPTIQEITLLQNESIAIEEQTVTMDAQVAKMNQMKSELEAIAAGEIKDVAEAREVVRNSFEIKTFEPDLSARDRWDDAYDRFRKICNV